MEQIKATFFLTFKPRMVCLLPIFTFTGVGMTMWACLSLALCLLCPFVLFSSVLHLFFVLSFVLSLGLGLGYELTLPRVFLSPSLR